MPASSRTRRIRHAQLEDLNNLVSFNAALAWETEGRRLDEDRLRLGTSALLNHPEHGRYLVAEDCALSTPHMIGQLMITFEWSDWRNGVFWWIQSVYVHPDWRRQGVFRQLYQHIRQEARTQSDVAGIRLYVEKENIIAQQTYQKLGLSQAPYQVFEEDFILPSPESSLSEE